MARETEATHQRELPAIKTLVVKVGSGVLAPEGTLDTRAVGRVARQISRLVERRYRVVLVSSGAVASGYRHLNLKRMPRTIVKKQAAAAIGQQTLMQSYTRAFGRAGLTVAQVLLTSDDMQHRERFINARHTLHELLDAGVVPIVNENDSVSFDEIKLGDNDQLSALVGTLIDADLLLLLTTVPGLRRHGGRGRVISDVRNARDVAEHIDGTKSATGIGGMATKVEAAERAAKASIPCIIADGRRSGVIDAILHGEPIGTFFHARKRKGAARQRWIGLASRIHGRLLVDAGAQTAIRERGASLLPSGVVSVEGAFNAGMTVAICDQRGDEFARGIVSYSSQEIWALRGCKTREITQRLGYNYSDEIIHRDDLMITESEDA